MMWTWQNILHMSYTLYKETELQNPPCTHVLPIVRQQEISLSSLLCNMTTRNPRSFWQPHATLNAMFWKFNATNYIFAFLHWCPLQLFLLLWTSLFTCKLRFCNIGHPKKRVPFDISFSGKKGFSTEQIQRMWFSVAHLLHENVVVMCLHVLQLAIHKAFMNGAHIICWSSYIRKYVHELASLLSCHDVWRMRHVIIILASSCIL